MRRLRFLMIGFFVLAIIVIVGCKSRAQRSPQQTEPTGVSPVTTTEYDITSEPDGESPQADGKTPRPTQPPLPGVVVLDDTIHNAVGVSWSPDGNRIAVALKQAVNLYDAVNNSLLLTIDVDAVISSPDVLWSPDAQTIAFGLANGSVAFHDAQTGAERFTLPGNGQDTLGMAWSADGRWFAVGHDGERVKLYDLQTGAQPVDITIGSHELLFSPDGMQLAGMYFGAWQAEIVDMTTHGILHTFEVGDYGDTIALSPDGSRIMVSYNNGETGIALFDTSTGERLRDLPIMQAQSMVWSPDGRFVVGTKGYGERNRNAVLVAGDLSTAMELTSLGTPPIEAAWSPDSTRIVTLHSRQVNIVTLSFLPGTEIMMQAAQALAAVPPHALASAITLVEPAAPPAPTPVADETATTFRGAVPHGALAQFGTGDLSAAEASPDGRWLAVSGRAGVTVYHADTYELAWTSRLGSISMMKWSPDSLVLAVGLYSGTIYALDAFHGQQLFEMTSHESAISSLQWDSSSQRLFSTEKQGIGLIWDMTNDDPPIALIRSDVDYAALSASWGAAFDNAKGRLSPDGRLYATFYEIGSGCGETRRFSGFRGKPALCGCGGGWDSSIVIWDAVTGVQYRIIQPAPVLNMIWLDSERILVVSTEGIISTWNATTGEKLSESDKSGDSNWAWYTQMTLDPTGTHIALDDGYGAATVLDLATGEFLYKLSNGEGSIQWLPDGQSFLTFSFAGQYAAIHRTSDGVELGRIADIKAQGALSADGSTLYAWSGSDGQTLSAYTLATGEHHSIFTKTPMLYSVSWSPDGAYVAAGITSESDYYYEVIVWNAQTGEVIRTFDMALADEYGFNQVKVAWSPDGTMLAAGAAQTIVWDVVSGAELSRIEGTTFGLAWSPDSTHLALGGERHILIVDPHTGEKLFTFKEHRTNNSNYAPMLPALDWSSDGQFIASGGTDSKALVWNASTGEVVMEFTLPSGDEAGLGISAVEFSPDGRSLAVGRAFDSTYVYDEETGTGEYVNDAPDAYVVDIASAQIAYYMGTIYAGVGGLDWSPDGTQIAMSFADPGFIYGMNYLDTGSSAILLWNAQSGEYLYTLTGHGSEIHSVEFSADSQRLASVSMDGTLLVWNMAAE